MEDRRFEKIHSSKQYTSSNTVHYLNIIIRTMILAILAGLLLFLYPSLTGHAQTWKATADVNVRDNATMDSNVITSLKKGAKVKQTGVDGHWIAIQSEGQTGYVYYKYLKKIADIKWYVKATAVNLRQGPTTESSKLGLLYQGEKVLVLSAGNEWSKVKTRKGKTGFVCNEYISKKKIKALSSDQDQGQGNGKEEKKRPAYKPDANTGRQLRKAAAHRSKINRYRHAAIEVAKKHLGDKYSQAKRNKKGYADCSSLMRDVFKAVTGEDIGGDTISQAIIMNEYMYPISSVYDAAPGDIVYHLSADNHTGIYLGNGQVLHASQSRGKVVISSFPEDGSFWEYGCNASLFSIIR